MSDDPAYALAHAAQARARRNRKRALAAARRSSHRQTDHAPRRSAAQRSGDRAEDRALAALIRAGLRLVARNYLCRAGEIDLVMQDGATLVFVEVRARSHAGYGGALASVDLAKQRRLARAAGHFLAARRGPPLACRFDVVAFDAHGDNIWIRGAFSLP